MASHNQALRAGQGSRSVPSHPAGHVPGVVRGNRHLGDVPPVNLTPYPQVQGFPIGMDDQAQMNAQYLAQQQAFMLRRVNGVRAIGFEHNSVLTMLLNRMLDPTSVLWQLLLALLRRAYKVTPNALWPRLRKRYPLR